MPSKRTTPFVLVPLTRNMFAKIDPADAERVCAYCWTATWSGHAWYANARIGGHQVSMHRFIVGAEPGSLWDHDNGDTLDNRRANLRPASPRESVGNTRKRRDNTSGFRGVTWHSKGRKWQAKISKNGKAISLGLYASADDAARAYDAAAIEWFGVEFTRLNFATDSKRSA